MAAIHPSIDEFHEKTRQGNLIPVWREMLADMETPVSAFRKVETSRFAFLLESVEGGENLGRYSFIGTDPSLIFKSKNGEHEVVFQSEEKDFKPRETSLETLRHLMRHYHAVPDPRLPPFFGGAVGYMSYDTVRDFERLPSVKPDDLHLPDCLFMVADTLVVFDHVRHRMILIANAHVTGDVETAYLHAVHRLNVLHDRLRGPLPPPTRRPGNTADAADGSHHPPGELAALLNIEAAAPVTPLVQPLQEDLGAPISPSPKENHPPLEGSVVVDPLGAGEGLRIVSNFSREDFEAAVLKCKDYILAGDIFQVVLSQRLSTRLTCDPFDVYRALRAVNPSPYMFYLKCGELRIAGSSPEILVTVKDNEVCVRPIAGTRPRGLTPEEDQALEKDLLADEKELAEHIMLVDLGRNDVGRVCEYGTVRVDDLEVIERYSHVMHIVSNVVGDLKSECDAFDALAATFPAGTVSGAPKIRAMEIIEELEPNHRGPYAGAVVYFGFTGAMDSGIMIRTAVIKGDTVHVQAGAGIVADSVPANEYHETLNKARALMKGIELAERGLD
jgi:anthranilate synthase component 1